MKCTFCGKDAAIHKGVNLIKNDGTVNFLCSSKCRRNATMLKRDKRKVRWTDAFHVTRTKARARAVENEKKAEESKAKVKESLIAKAKKEVKKEVVKKTVKKVVKK